MEQKIRSSDNGGYGIFYRLDYDWTVPSLSPADVPSSSPVVSSLVKVCTQFNSTQLEKAEKILEYLKSKTGSCRAGLILTLQN